MPRFLLSGLPGALLVPMLAGVALGAEPQQQNDASRAAAAEALFEEAVKLVEAGKFGEACPKFAASERLDPGAGTLLNLGSCYEKNGQSASAWATFIEAESVATKAGHKDWAARAHEHSEKIAPHLPKLVVVPTEKLQGFVVTRDGVALDEGAWGVPIPLDPGGHDLSATAPQKQPWSMHIELKADEPPVTVTVPPLVDVPVAPPPPVVPPPPPEVTPPPPPLPPPPPRPGFWTTTRGFGVGVCGLGVASVGIGAVLVAVAKSKYDDAIGKCGPDGMCPSNQSDAYNEGNTARSFADAATVMIIAGGVVAATGGALVLLGGPKEDRATSAPTVKLAPTLGPRLAGAALEGAW
jgi:hypothetical protein